MRHYGIDDQYLLQAETCDPLPSWEAKYTRSFIYDLDTKTMYYATDTKWVAVSANVLAGYIHPQASASATWSVVHDLGVQDVSVTVYGEDNKVMMPIDIETISVNALTITFGEAVAGKAVIVTGNPGTVTYSQQKVTLAKGTSLADGDWKGLAITGAVGGSITKGDLCYCKLNLGAWKYYRYDADATDKLILPSALALDSYISGDGSFLIDGEMRNDAWTGLAGTADASTTVYASTATGNLTMTAPAVSGNEVVVVGVLIAAYTLQLKIGYAWLEVK